jgi:hypothetical protein
MRTWKVTSWRRRGRSPSRWHQMTAFPAAIGLCVRPKTFFSACGKNSSFSYGESTTNVPRGRRA